MLVCICSIFRGIDHGANVHVFNNRFSSSFNSGIYQTKKLKEPVFSFRIWLHPRKVRDLFCNVCSVAPFSKALKHAKVAMIAWLLWCPFCIFNFSQQSRLFLLLSGIMFSLWMISNMVLCSDILLPIFFPRWTAHCYLCSCPEIWTGIVYKTCRNA